MAECVVLAWPYLPDPPVTHFSEEWSDGTIHQKAVVGSVPDWAVGRGTKSTNDLTCSRH